MNRDSHANDHDDDDDDDSDQYEDDDDGGIRRESAVALILKRNLARLTPWQLMVVLLATLTISCCRNSLRSFVVRAAMPKRCVHFSHLVHLSHLKRPRNHSSFRDICEEMLPAGAYPRNVDGSKRGRQCENDQLSLEVIERKLKKLLVCTTWRSTRSCEPISSHGVRPY